MTEERKDAPAEKKRRLDAQDLEDHTVAELTKAIGPRLKLAGRDLPSNVVRFGILDLLTVKDRAAAFQHGYLYLPPPMDSKAAVPEGAREFVIPQSVAEAWFQYPEVPDTLIKFWQRSAIGAEVTKLVFQSKIDVDDSFGSLLLPCFPKATSITLTTSNMDAVFQALRDRPMVQFKMSTFAVVLADYSVVRAALRTWSATLQSLELDSGCWQGDTDEENDELVSLLGPNVHTLALCHMSLPSVTTLKLLWTTCPKLTTWSCTTEESGTDYSGRLAASLQGDTRLWRSVTLSFGGYSGGAVNTDDLLAVAGKELRALRVGNVLESRYPVKLDLAKVLAKCSALEYLDIDLGISEKDRAEMMQAMYQSTSAPTLIESWPTLDWRNEWDEKSIIELYERLPRLEKVNLAPRRCPSRLLQLLAQSNHRNRLVSVNLSIAEEDVKTMGAVLANSTRWTFIEVKFPGKTQLPAETIAYLARSCDDLEHLSIEGQVEALPPETLRAILHRMRNRKLLWLGCGSDIVPNESKLITRQDLLTYSERPRELHLLNTALVSLSGADLVALNQPTPRRRPGRHISLLVTRQAAIDAVATRGFDGRFDSLATGVFGTYPPYTLGSDTSAKYVVCRLYV